MSNGLVEWLATPLGRYLLGREQAWFDRTVADIFGFNAVQVGLPACPFLAQSRIVARFTVDVESPAQVLADPNWLPFPENSLDLVVLPHALEFTEEPHKLLREVYRTVRPEGQIVLAGFNPFSLFGARRYFGRGETPPWNGNFIALYRLKDWLALLGFEVSGGSLDCYVPPFTQERWLRRCRFFESAGDRWWPIGGGVYFLRATKKVLGMRVITPAWERPKNGLAPAPGQVRVSEPAVGKAWSTPERAGRSPGPKGPPASDGGGRKNALASCVNGAEAARRRASDGRRRRALGTAQAVHRGAA